MLRLRRSHRPHHQQRPARRKCEQGGAGDHVFGRACDWAGHERQRDDESADQGGNDNPAHSRCHYRISALRVFPCWQPVQLHDGPHVQTSPHWHDAADRAAAFWHPQVHAEPLHALQEQTFELGVMCSSFVRVDVMSTNEMESRTQPPDWIGRSG